MTISPIVLFLAGLAIIVQCILNYQIIMRIKNPYIGIGMTITNTLTILVGFIIAGKAIIHM